MCCGLLSCTARLVLFATNFVVFVASAVVLAISAWALAVEASLTDLLGAVSGDPDGRARLLNSAPVVLVVASAVMMVVSAFGCCGAFKSVF
jgi:uncharacterized membrane protein